MNAKERRAAQAKAKEQFLASLRADPNVSLACDVADISRETAYRWRDNDEAFKKAWETAVERCRDVARSAIYQRGIHGWDEPLVSMGQLVYEMAPVLDAEGNQRYERGKPMMKRVGQVMVHKWSDSLALAYAKANLPEYREKQTIDLNAQITTLADQAKNELLADLAATIAADEAQTEAP